jgi:hypothetical protein
MGGSHGMQAMESDQPQQQQQQQLEEGEEDKRTAEGGDHLHRRRLPACLPSLTVTSSPLPVLPSESLARVRQDAASLMLVLCLTMAASVLTASFAVYLVRWVWTGVKCSRKWSGDERRVVC